METFWIAWLILTAIDSQMLMQSGCMAPLITLLRSISSTKFHFEASFEASSGAARVIAASICLLHIAAAFSEEATDLLVQVGHGWGGLTRQHWLISPGIYM